MKKESILLLFFFLLFFKSFLTTISSIQPEHTALGMYARMQCTELDLSISLV